MSLPMDSDQLSDFARTSQSPHSTLTGTPPVLHRARIADFLAECRAQAQQITLIREHMAERGRNRHAGHLCQEASPSVKGRGLGDGALTHLF